MSVDFFSHLICHGGVEAEDVAEALDELQGRVSELSCRPGLVRERVGAAAAVFLDGRDRLQHLFLLFCRFFVHVPVKSRHRHHPSTTRIRNEEAKRLLVLCLRAHV